MVFISNVWVFFVGGGFGFCRFFGVWEGRQVLGFGFRSVIVFWVVVVGRDFQFEVYGDRFYICILKWI